MENEIFFSSSDSAESHKISKLLKNGQIRKIAPRIYSNNFKLSPEVLIQNNLFKIVEHFYPDVVLVHRSAFEVKAKEGLLVLSGKARSKVDLPGVTLLFIDEKGADINKDIPFLGRLFIAHEARAFLENLTRSRTTNKTKSKNLPIEEIEKRLLDKLEFGGEDALNKLRDEAKVYAESNDLKREFDKLNKMIGALLGTKETNALASSRSQAFLKGLDYDEARLRLFTDFYITLKDWKVKIGKDRKMQIPEHFKYKAFFESYFSNYIEGTEFEIEEAEEIIFDKKISSRPQDAHDILGTFKIVSDAGEMRKIPKSEDELISLLKERHQIMMDARPEVMPGKWKTKNNRAGNTHFVDVKRVEGTLRRAFSLLNSLPSGLQRSAFIMLVITEVHPFIDGNGRMARIMMNAELEAEGLGSIIIPNVYREDYLLALKAVSKQGRFSPYLKMFERALRFSNMIDFENYQNALKEIHDRNWFLLPSEGKIIDV